jgi:hypothetical protein
MLGGQRLAGPNSAPGKGWRRALEIEIARRCAARDSCRRPSARGGDARRRSALLVVERARERSTSAAAPFAVERRASVSNPQRASPR